ncbi:MAG: hypothetical protein ACI959_000830 [Limisphaerales bacterium]|jgi:hypothetical protein
MAKDLIDAPEELQLEGWQAVEKKIMDNKNIIVGGVVLVALVLGGIYAYNNLFLKPREVQAANSIYFAQNDFAKDSMSLALNGKNGNPGFLDIASNYGATKTGKLANGYAAICFLNQGDFANTLKYGKKFKSDDEWLNARVNEVMGHAASEQGDFTTGIKYYRMAAEASDNEITAPYNYYLAGMAAMENENTFPEANKYFQLIKDKYPRSKEGQNIDKYIALTD